MLMRSCGIAAAESIIWRLADSSALLRAKNREESVVARADADQEGCLACDLTAGRRPVPGGRIDQTGHWVVEHCVGPLGVGTLIVKPLRHLVHVADLSEDESAELGPLLRRMAMALTEVLQPEQVYVCLWSHANATPVHIHFVVQPVTRESMDRSGAHGPALQVAMFGAGEAPPEEDVTAVCDRIRATLRRARANT
jgi:diadenosine tetraphosphate (Ap4A) HIT family hydrolase